MKSLHFTCLVVFLSLLLLSFASNPSLAGEKVLITKEKPLTWTVYRPCEIGFIYAERGGGTVTAGIACQEGGVTNEHTKIRNKIIVKHGSGFPCKITISTSEDKGVWIYIYDGCK